MSWIFNHKTEGKHRVCFFIGQVKIAEIAPFKAHWAEKWSFYLHLFNHEVEHSMENKYPTFGAALSALHKHLNSPPARRA